MGCVSQLALGYQQPHSGPPVDWPAADLDSAALDDFTDRGAGVGSNPGLVREHMGDELPKLGNRGAGGILVFDGDRPVFARRDIQEAVLKHAMLDVENGIHLAILWR